MPVSFSLKWLRASSGQMNIWFLIKPGYLCGIYRMEKYCTRCARILTFVLCNISWVLWDTWERSVSGKPSVIFVWLPYLHLLIPNKSCSSCACLPWEGAQILTLPAGEHDCLRLVKSNSPVIQPPLWPTKDPVSTSHLCEILPLHIPPHQVQRPILV